MPHEMIEQLAEHVRVVESMRPELDLFDRIAARIIECFQNGGKVLLLGNGGSAADAQHIAAELVGRFKRNRRALPAIALTTDTSNLTAIANDLGAEFVFSRQVEALAAPGDVVWALSVSGRSPNVIRAMHTAGDLRTARIGFTGRAGAMLRDLCDLCFSADHESSDRVQEAHQLAYHLICDQIERHYGR